MISSMKRRRLIVYSLSHTWLVVDITAIGLPNEIYPKEGNEQMVPTLRFQSWKHVKQYLFGNQGRDVFV
jgi:hypothetical protein